MQSNLEQAVAFYEHLGLKRIFHLKDAWAEFDLNGVKIGLCPTTAPVIDRRVGAVFEVPDVHAFYADHKESGMFVNEPAEALHGIMVSFKDPGGNIIDLYQSTPERVKAFAQRVASQGCCKGPKATACCKPSESA